MLKLHFAGPEGHPFVSTLGNLSANDGATLVGVSRTAAATVTAMRSSGIDALLFPIDWADIMRTLRSSTSGSNSGSLIVVAERLAPPALVRTLACGFDGAIGIDRGPGSAIDQVSRIVDGTWTFDNEPSLRGLAVSHGLLARTLTFTNDDEKQVADLVGTGLTDDEIAALLGWTIQQVRNSIERLLSANALTYRTQLAVIRAASLKVPDFS